MGTVSTKAFCCLETVDGFKSESLVEKQSEGGNLNFHIYDTILILIWADSRGVEGVVDQGMILGWRSPINPLNSGQPQPRIWCSTGQYVLFVTTITAGWGHGAAEQRWSDQSQGGHVGQTSAIWSHFTTPHLHNVNNHNKHEHIPQLNVFWILKTLRQYILSSL